MTRLATHPLAQALCNAWATGQSLSTEQAHQLAPQSSDEAYLVQQQVAAQLNFFDGQRPTAWKVGGNRELPAATPIADAHTVSAPFTFDTSTAHNMLGIEAELAVQLKAPLWAGSTRQEAQEAIGHVVVAIELCDVRAIGWPQLPPHFLLADQQMNRCLILGSGLAEGWQPQFAHSTASLSVNGTTLQEKQSAHPLNDPLALLPWLANHAEKQVGSGLAAGDWITTGAWLGIYEAKPGDTIVVSFSGIGEARCTLSS